MVTIRTDERGHRIAEGDGKSAEGTKIVFAGDSFVFGNEVNAEETFVHLIGKAAGPSRHAVDLGVGAYFLSQECLSLRRYLARDISVAGAFLGLYIGNDLEAGPYPPATMGVDGNGYLRPRAGTDLESIILRNSRLAFSLYGAWRLLRPEQSSLRSDTPLAKRPVRQSWIYDPSAFTPDRIDEHKRVLQALRDDAALRLLPITVVLIPEYDQVYGAAR